MPIPRMIRPTTIEATLARQATPRSRGGNQGGSRHSLAGLGSVGGGFAAPPASGGGLPVPAGSGGSTGGVGLSFGSLIDRRSSVRIRVASRYGHPSRDRRPP